VPEDYEAYLVDMAKTDTWGDHVTLQAAADRYGLRIMLITSYKENCVVAIDPAESQSR
jgi:hypothetical protein